MGDTIQEGCFLHSSFSKEEKLTGTSIDSLHMDILVRIVCKVSHDELKALSNVSTRFREAVACARQMHFDYNTPVRRQTLKRGAIIIKSNESSERSEDMECTNPSKRHATPNAPKQTAKFRKLQLSSEVLKELAILLFPSDEPIMNDDATTYVANEIHVG